MIDQVTVGDIVEVHAVDWGLYQTQVPGTTEFDIVRGRIYGQVVRIADDSITVAPQVFEDDGVRFALALPIVTITNLTVLKKGTNHAPH